MILKTAAIVAISAIAFTLPAWTGTSDTLTYESRQGLGTLTLQSIGSPAYSRSCTIVEAWEDHSAIAHCTEDGATWAYDPDGSPEIAGTTRTPSWGAGWYPIN